VLPNSHARSTELEFFETSTIKVKDEIMLFNIGITNEQR